MPTVAEAEKTLADAKALLAAAEEDAKVAAEAAARPRPVGSVLIDIVRELVSRAGNHPDLEKLSKELEASVALTEPK